MQSASDQNPVQGWYVQVHGQAYGPYSEAQMQSFVSEGRITAESLISNTPQAGFFAAVGYDIFGLWAGTGHTGVAPVQPQMDYTPQAEAYQAPDNGYAYQKPQPAAATPASASQTSVYFIMAEIRSGSEMAFLQALQSFGAAERIGDTVWIIRTSASAEQLRNKLSQSMSRQDRLFILDSRANKPVWFNIGADLDHRIRTLWQDEDES